MIIPSGMTEESVIKQINKVVNKIAPKYVFYGYTVDDIKQESFIICMDALSRYDSSRPLENFLSVHLSNRLKNFVRDNHYTNTDDEKRVKVAKPAQLDHENSILDDRDSRSTEDYKIDYKEMQDIINRKLPATYRLDYLKIVHDVYVNKNRKDEIFLIIDEILMEHGYEKRPNI
jgi:hypothetical protein